MTTNQDEPSISNETLPCEVRENTAATWNYHLAHEDTPHEALCGERVMGTGLDLTDWGKTSPAHLHITFCDECERLAIQKAREGTW